MEKAERISQKARSIFKAHQTAKLQNINSKPKFKYGFEIPKSYKHAIEIDKWNGNTLWQDATKV